MYGESHSTQSGPSPATSCDKINQLNKSDKESYKRALFIHVDSRSRSKQTDVYFYNTGSRASRNLTNTMKNVFQRKYAHHQPGRGFRGTVSKRDLFVLRNTTPGLPLSNWETSRTNMTSNVLCWAITVKRWPTGSVKHLLLTTRTTRKNKIEIMSNISPFARPVYVSWNLLVRCVT